MRRLRRMMDCFFAGLLVFGFCVVPVWAQSSGCKLTKETYTCDRLELRQALVTASTAEVDPHTKDRMVAAKLRDLVAALGKRAPTAGQPAELTFSLIAVDTAGVMVGPAGVDLAALRIYGPASGETAAGGGPRTLLWVETLRGQPDMSWPAMVQATINQFQAGLKR